jgi:RNA-directed DNA polymerase
MKVTFCVRGVLSPLLSNLVLSEMDRELERRGHRFVRYADDCNIYVRSEKAGRRVMASLARFIERRLKRKRSASGPAQAAAQTASSGCQFQGRSSAMRRAG